MKKTKIVNFMLFESDHSFNMEIIIIQHLDGSVEAKVPNNFNTNISIISMEKELHSNNIFNNIQKNNILISVRFLFKFRFD